MSKLQPNTQSATSRRLVEAEARAIFAKHSPTHLGVIDSVRRWVRKRLPTAHELVYEYRNWFVVSYSPNEHGYAGVLAIRANSEGVKMYFSGGKQIPDPKKLLQGTGKQMRWIHLESMSAITCPEVESLIDEAIAQNRVPFARTGKGPVVIRSASA